MEPRKWGRQQNRYREKTIKIFFPRSGPTVHTLIQLFGRASSGLATRLTILGRTSQLLTSATDQLREDVRDTQRFLQSKETTFLGSVDLALRANGS